jgi:hypothetical protein
MLALPPVADWLDLENVFAAALIATISACGTELAESVPISPPPAAPSPQLQRIQITPKTTSLFPGGRQQFTTEAVWSTGQPGSLTLSFTATGGTVTVAGLYAAGQSPGSYLVIVSAVGSPIADTAAVSILPAPLPGQYTPLIARDWSKFPDKASVRPLFGVEGRLNDCGMVANKTFCEPWLPVEDFFDLVDDPLFGKVIRYNGDPKLNTTLTTMPGRVAMHGVKLPDMTDVWVRQFVRFSANYTTMSSRGGQGASSHKMMFLRYKGSSARQSWIIEGPRGMTHEDGRSQRSQTVVASGSLPFSNATPMNVVYGSSGWGSPDAYPMLRASVGPKGAPTGPGNGEWYEIILHHKAAGPRGEHTLAWRQYTVGGKPAPGSWKIGARWAEFAPGATWLPMARYEMGVNRNRQWDEVMYLYWGPYEIVDGTVHPNPWGLPGG